MEVIAHYYQIEVGIVEKCLEVNSKRLDIDTNDLIAILTRLIPQKVNFDDISFDLIQKYFFAEKSFEEILVLCRLNKKLYSKCQKSHLYWKNYAREHFQIEAKPEKYKSWFDLVRYLHLTPYSVLSIKKLDINTSKLIYKRDKFIYYTQNIQIKPNYDLLLLFTANKKKIKYELKTEHKFKKGFFHLVHMAEISFQYIFIGLSVKGEVFAYQIDATDQNNIKYTSWGYILGDVQDLCIEDTFQKNFDRTYLVTTDAIYVWINHGVDLGSHKLISTPTKFKEIILNRGQKSSMRLIDVDGYLWELHFFDLKPTYTFKKITTFKQYRQEEGKIIHNISKDGLKFKTMNTDYGVYNKAVTVNNELVEVSGKQYTHENIKFSDNFVVMKMTMGDILMYKPL